MEKAFDKISHFAILNKLKSIKLNKYLYNRIVDFLKDRKFYISLNKLKSKTFNISTGVPQGSCLSPTLFSLFFSDVVLKLPNHILKALFADDLKIWTVDKTLKKIQKKLQQAIEIINDFCKAWRLKINMSKTVYCVFTTAGCRINYKNTYKLDL